MIWADLHCHSTWSDGSQKIVDLLLAAHRRGLTHLSVTDHDTTAHFTDLYKYAGQSPLKLLTGIEISACDTGSGRKVHLLGYGLGCTAAVEALCTPVREQRNEMTERSITILAQAGYSLSPELVRRHNGYPPVLYKQHIMNVLVDQGKAYSIYGELYKELFKNGGPCSDEIAYCSWQDAIQAVKEDGGLAVLAHPGQQSLWDLVPSMAAYGLSGIELYHESHSLPDHKKVISCASQYSLFTTGGSDTHGTLGSLNPLGAIVAPETVASGPLGERFF